MSKQTMPRFADMTDEQRKAYIEAQAKLKSEITPYDGIAVDEKPDELTIRITGNALANIRELQRIVNEVTGEDGTTKDFAWEWLLDWDWLKYLGSKVAPDFEQTLAGLIVSAFDGDDAKELKRRFLAAGFTVW